MTYKGTKPYVNLSKPTSTSARAGKINNLHVTPQMKASIQPKKRTVPTAPAVYHPQPAHKVAQAKKSSGPPRACDAKKCIERPSPPQTFRARTGNEVAQAKTSVARQNPVQTGRAPAAPPVYRPQPTPRVLQTKKASGRQPEERVSRMPVAPPVYRPEQKRVAQPKMRADAQTRNAPARSSTPHTPASNTSVAGVARETRAHIGGAPRQTALASPRVIQRMALPLDDLVALGSKKKVISSKEEESARTMFEAVGNRVRATGEGIARPHQLTSQSDEGGLSKLGLTEELRIFGHGATSQHDPNGEALQVGGHTPTQLATLLINMGLPKEYQGEIYLSGCVTAVGPNHGFLEKFYNQIKTHSPGVVVRGNLGDTTTFEDGTQGVWTGFVSESEYNKQIELFNEMIKKLLSDNQHDLQLLQQGKMTPLEANQKLQKNKELLESVASSKSQYDRTVYDTTGAHTVQLPSKTVRAQNAVSAIATGAIKSNSDINNVMARIDHENLNAANQQLNASLVGTSNDISELIKSTNKLSIAPLTFKKKKF